MGPALGLWLFLVQWQNRPDGSVQQGRAITYAWIRSKFPNAPPYGTMRRWMARLVREGFIEQRLVSRPIPGKGRHVVGFAVRILNQTKFEVQQQRPLFAPPKPVEIVCKTLLKSSESREGGTCRTERRVRAEVNGQGFKERKQEYEIRKSGAHDQRAFPSPPDLVRQTERHLQNPESHQPMAKDIRELLGELAKRKAM